MKSLSVVLLLALGMPACSMLTKSGRQERAYSKYVRKMSASRDKQRIREIKQRAEMPKLRPAPVSEPVENIQVSESQ
jgi:hypothetical protein